MTVTPKISINDGNLVIHGKTILSAVSDNIVLTPGTGKGIETSAYIGATVSNTKSIHVFPVGVLHDKSGRHNLDLLKKLVLHDGSILRAQLPARPTVDSLFVDPARALLTHSLLIQQEMGKGLLNILFHIHLYEFDLVISRDRV
ncbi:hypothetical protein RYX36_034183 [Vicia faba]